MRIGDLPPKNLSRNKTVSDKWLRKKLRIKPRVERPTNGDRERRIRTMSVIKSFREIKVKLQTGVLNRSQRQTFDRTSSLSSWPLLTRR